jgi:hypothetical protein
MADTGRPPRASIAYGARLAREVRVREPEVDERALGRGNCDEQAPRRGNLLAIVNSRLVHDDRDEKL